MTLHDALVELRLALRALRTEVWAGAVDDWRRLCARLLFARWPGPLHHLPRVCPWIGPWLAGQALGRQGSRIDRWRA